MASEGTKVGEGRPGRHGLSTVLWESARCASPAQPVGDDSRDQCCEYGQKTANDPQIERPARPHPLAREHLIPDLRPLHIVDEAHRSPLARKLRPVPNQGQWNSTAPPISAGLSRMCSWNSTAPSIAWRHLNSNLKCLVVSWVTYRGADTVSVGAANDLCRCVGLCLRDRRHCLSISLTQALIHRLLARA